MDDLKLVQMPAGLTLTDGTMELCAGFADMLPRVKPGKLSHELLVKAAKVKGLAAPRVFDMTAGLGNDSFLLAAAGFDVTLCEQDRTIAALLQDALDRAALDDELAPIMARMHFVPGDSIVELAKLMEAGARPDVVYLDPMFPERKKSAAVKKKFQLLHHLERPCSNEGEMLSAALAAATRKVVVKRPIKGEFLAGRKPRHTVRGKAVRYDVLIP